MDPNKLMLRGSVALVVSLVLTSTAVAFDCIRVSSTLQGLEQSTRSGKWFVFDLSSVSGVQRTLEAIGETIPTDEQAACFVSTYAQSGQPRFFAVGKQRDAVLLGLGIRRAWQSTKRMRSWGPPPVHPPAARAGGLGSR